MSRGRKHEPTQPGNPRQLTIDQHIRSKSCIKRFANGAGLVGIWPFTSKPFLTGPRSRVFCARRVWDQRLEHGGLFVRIEAAFHQEAKQVILHRTVSNHDAVNEYLSVWRIRTELDAQRPSDTVLRGLSEASTELTKDQEEILESKHGAFLRGNTVPARFVASMLATRKHDANIETLSGVRWGVFRATATVRFISPDRPDNQLYMPICPGLALVAGAADQEVSDEAVDELNRQTRVRSRKYIFGHPDDVDAFYAKYG